ncbi:SpoIIE family protein phosphatase [Spirochaetota bacterium]
MEKFFLLDASIDHVAMIIVNFAIAGYLFSLKNKDKSTWMLAFYFLSFGIFSIRLFLHVSWLDYNFMYLTEMGMALLFVSLFFFIPFSLYYYKPFNKIATGIILTVAILITVGFFGLYAFLAIRSPWTVFQFASDQFFFNNTGRFIGIPATVLNFTPAFVLYLKSVKYSENKDNLFKRLFFAKGRISKSCKRFAWALLSLMLPAASGTLAYLGILSYDIVRIIMIMSTLLLIFVVVIVYLNNSMEPTTFMIKIIGITLVTVIIFFAVVGLLVITWEKDGYDRNRLSEVKNIERYLNISEEEKVPFGELIKDKKIIIPGKIRYISSRPVSDGIYSKNYSLLYNRTKNISSEELYQSDKLEKDNKIRKMIRSLEGKKIKDGDGKTRILSNDDAKRIALEKISEEKVVLMKRGGRVWDYSDLKTYYTTFKFRSNGSIYELGYEYTDYRKKIHVLSFWLLIVLLILCVVILGIFPLFFRSVLTVPLRVLLGGVREVNEGNLAIQVPIKTQDEIGFLASSFNSMVASISKAQSELKYYAENLENMVRERTEELQAAMEELEATNEALVLTRDSLWGEMEIAKKIQTVLLPESPSIDGFEISAKMIPAENVGGDYYDVINYGGIDWLIIGDVSGHGVPAGLIMMMAQTSIHSVLEKHHNLKPSKLLSLVNKVLRKNIILLKEDKYMTITALAALKDGKFMFSGLHQNIYIYRAQSGNVDSIETDGAWVGLLDDVEDKMNNKILQLNRGDTMILYTDGIVEAWLEGTVKDKRDPEMDMYGDDKLIELLRKNGNDNCDNIKKAILDSLNEYAVDDDVTIVVIKRTA